MKPPPFEYAAPASLEEALELRARHGADSVVLAGGQSLMPLLNLRLALPAVVIDIGRVPELAGIRSENGALAIGAMTRQRDLERSELVGQRSPLLARAVPWIGHPTIRNRGTLGGSLAHADPAAELPATALALDVELVARSVRGRRTIPARDFFQDYLTTALEPDELLVEARVPELRGGTGVHEVARRHGDFALAGAVAVVSIEAGVIQVARIGLLGVGSTPTRATEAEAMLRGARPGDALFREAAEKAAASLEPSSDVHASAGYRRRVAAVLIRRALMEAAS